LRRFNLQTQAVSKIHERKLPRRDEVSILFCTRNLAVKTLGILRDVMHPHNPAPSSKYRFFGLSEAFNCFA